MSVPSLKTCNLSSHCLQLCSKTSAMQGEVERATDGLNRMMCGTEKPKTDRDRGVQPHLLVCTARPRNWLVWPLPGSSPHSSYSYYYQECQELSRVGQAPVWIWRVWLGLCESSLPSPCQAFPSLSVVHYFFFLVHLGHHPLDPGLPVLMAVAFPLVYSLTIQPLCLLAAIF